MEVVWREEVVKERRCGFGKEASYCKWVSHL